MIPSNHSDWRKHVWLETAIRESSIEFADVVLSEFDKRFPVEEEKVRCRNCHYGEAFIGGKFISCEHCHGTGFIEKG